MAKFRISALPASFYAAGDHKMVSVGMMAEPIISEVIECKSVADVSKAVADVAERAKAEHPGASFSMRQRLIDGRAPAGYRGKYFGLDFDAA
jgi:hypothetical protein